MENPISHEYMDVTDVVYGDSPPPQEGEWVLFMPRGLAEALKTLGNVLAVKTWGQLKTLLPQAMYQDILEKVQGQSDYEGEQIEEGEGDEEGERAWREPAPDTPFSVDDLYGYSEMEWPYVWATQFQQYWIPDEIIEEFGDEFGGMTMGRAVLF